MKLVLATCNTGKVREIKHILSGMDVRVSSLTDYPEVPQVVEDGGTFLDNARKKAREVASATKAWVLADDSGLVVDALGGEPGVHSARYSGAQGDYAANNKKLLQEMQGVPDGRRQAAFVCVMVLVSPDGREWDVEGRCEGVIGHKPKGCGGFGYDPLFFVPNEGKTMAELTMDKKNSISHRGRVLDGMKEVLAKILKGE